MIGGSTWAIVLAAGDGNELDSLTTEASGLAVPKQYCSLHNGSSLLQRSLECAQESVSTERTCVVVAAQHREWWGAQLASTALLRQNVFVQREDRGTAIEILWPLLQILRSDPAARIAVLPSDHYVRDQDILARAVKQSFRLLESAYSEVLLFGQQAESADPDAEYIVPGFSTGYRTFQVSQLIGKPGARRARDLINRGALWNSSVLTASGRALLTLFERFVPDILLDIRSVMQSGEPEALQKLYDRLPMLDFWQDIVVGQEAHLQVFATPPCGWSDLATHRRVAEALCRMTYFDSPQIAQHGDDARGGAPMSLAFQHAQMYGANVSLDS